MSGWSATHMHKRSSRYVQLVVREGGTVIYRDIEEKRERIMEDEFDRDFLDLSTLKGYSDNGSEKASSKDQDRPGRRDRLQEEAGGQEGQEVGAAARLPTASELKDHARRTARKAKRHLENPFI